MLLFVYGVYDCLHDHEQELVCFDWVCHLHRTVFGISDVVQQMDRSGHDHGYDCCREDCYVVVCHYSGGVYPLDYMMVSGRQGNLHQRGFAPGVHS